jgi:hypothetical protein
MLISPPLYLDVVFLLFFVSQEWEHRTPLCVAQNRGKNNNEKYYYKIKIGSLFFFSKNVVLSNSFDRTFAYKWEDHGQPRASLPSFLSARAK